jgi:hypothetical protein
MAILLNLGGNQTALVSDLHGRLSHTVQISADALRAYVDAIEQSFGADVGFGQIVKTYEHDYSQHPEYKYSAPTFVTVDKRAVTGSPDMDLVSTSYIERLNEVLPKIRTTLLGVKSRASETEQE